MSDKKSFDQHWRESLQQASNITDDELFESYYEEIMTEPITRLFKEIWRKKIEELLKDK